MKGRDRCFLPLAVGNEMGWFERGLTVPERGEMKTCWIMFMKKDLKIKGIVECLKISGKQSSAICERE